DGREGESLWPIPAVLPFLPFPPVKSSGYRRRVFELLGLVMRDDILEQLGQIAVQDFSQSVRREVDAMIRNPVLREVIGPDLLGPLARAHLTTPVFRDRFLLLAQL